MSGFARLAVCAVLLTALMVTAPQARAGALSPCNNPITFDQALVQVFLLPPEATGQLSRTAQQLATVLQRHILFAALKYPAIGVEELTSTGPMCTVASTRARIEGRLHPGQAAIFVRTRLFEESDALYWQTTLSFSVAQSSVKIRWPIGTAGETTATIPDDPLLFEPRHIPLAWTLNLQRAAAESTALHKTPEQASPLTRLPDDPSARFGFAVLETRGDWMHVRILPGGALDGWLNAHGLASSDELKNSFPELYFVDGLIGSFEAMLMKDASASQHQRLVAWAQEGFQHYRDASPQDGEPDSRALARILFANLQLPVRWSERDIGQLQAALAEYQKAQLEAPGYSVADNHALACATALCALGACNDAERLHKGYLDALAKDPANPELKANLAVLYASAQLGGPLKLAMDSKELQRRRMLLVSGALH